MFQYFLNLHLFHPLRLCICVFVVVAGATRMFMTLGCNVTKYVVDVYRCRCRWLKLIYVNVQNVCSMTLKIYHPSQPTPLLPCTCVCIIFVAQCKKSKFFFILILLCWNVVTCKVNAKCDHACKQKCRRRSVCTPFIPNGLFSTYFFSLSFFTVTFDYLLRCPYLSCDIWIVASNIYLLYLHFNKSRMRTFCSTICFQIERESDVEEERESGYR